MLLVSSNELVPTKMKLTCEGFSDMSALLTFVGSKLPTAQAGADIFLSYTKGKKGAPIEHLDALEAKARVMVWPRA